MQSRILVSRSIDTRTRTLETGPGPARLAGPPGPPELNLDIKAQAGSRRVGVARVEFLS